MPIPSMYGVLTYIWLILMVNVGRYTGPMDAMGWISLFFSQNSQVVFPESPTVSQFIIGSAIPGPSKALTRRAVVKSPGKPIVSF